MNFMRMFTHQKYAYTQKLRKQLNLFGKKINYDSKEQDKIIKRHGSNKPRLSVLGLSPADLNQFSQEELVVLMSLVPTKEQMQCFPRSKYVIPLNFIWKNVFDMIMDCVVIFSTISSLFYLAFQPEVSNLMRIVDNLIWALFLIDFFLNFFTARINKKGFPVYTFNGILKIYSKTWMVPDFLAIIPLKWTDNPNTECFLRLTRVFKSHRLFDRINIFKFANQVTNLLLRSENSRKKRCKLWIIYSWELVGYLWLTVYSTYCLACLWIFYVEVVHRNIGEKENFESYFGFNPGYSSDKLVKTWYFVFTTLMTVGYGDFYAVNKYEMIVDIIFVLSGTTWFTFVMGKSKVALTNLQELSSKRQDTGDLNFWIYQIENNFCRLPNSLKKQINLHFFHCQWNDRLRDLATLEIGANSTAIRCEFFKVLSDDLKERIFEFLFSDIFYKFRFFFKFLGSSKYTIAGCLQPRFFTKNSIIQGIHEPVHEINFVYSGVFQICAQVGKNIIELYTIDSSFLIGEFFVLNSINSFAVFQTVAGVHAYSIPTHILVTIQKNNPEMVSLYLKSIERRYKFIREKINIVTEKGFLETNELDTSSRKIYLLPEDRDSFKSKYILKDDISEPKTEAIMEFAKIEEAVKKFKQLRKSSALKVEQKLSIYINKKLEQENSVFRKSI